MGLVLMFGAFVGGVVGLALSVVLTVIAVRRLRRPTTGPAPSGLAFGVASGVLLVGLFTIVGALPLPEARPGSDYDIMLVNLALRSFGYGASPGLALLLAVWIARRLRPTAR